MAAKKDSQLGITATVYTSRDQIVDACKRATTVLGRHVSLTVGSAKVTINVLPGPRAKIPSPVVGVAMRPLGDGIGIIVRAETWRTSQSQMMFIGVGPKFMVGASHYKKLLNALEAEFASIATPRGKVTRVEATK